MHCSAFAANGRATRDGKIVFGHITMSGLYPSGFYNVWLDVKPARGHRVLMQTYPGGIQSGLDYYLNDAGLLVCETTLAQTAFRHHRHDRAPRASARRCNTPTASTRPWRFSARATTVCTPTNGCWPTSRPTKSPCSSWARTRASCTAAARTNGTAARRVFTGAATTPRTCKSAWRRSPASRDARPSAVFRPSERDKKWLDLYDQHKGKMDADVRQARLHHATAGRLSLRRCQVHDHRHGPRIEDVGVVRPAAGPDVEADLRGTAALLGSAAAGQQSLGDPARRAAQGWPRQRPRRRSAGPDARRQNVGGAYLLGPAADRRGLARDAAAEDRRRRLAGDRPSPITSASPPWRIPSANAPPTGS